MAARVTSNHNSAGTECCTEYRKLSFSNEPSIQELIKERPFPLCSFKTSIQPSTWVVPRSVFERSGGFCEAFKGAQGYEDWWMLLLLCDLGEFVYVPGQADPLSSCASVCKSTFLDCPPLQDW